MSSGRARRGATYSLVRAAAVTSFALLLPGCPLSDDYYMKQATPPQSETEPVPSCGNSRLELGEDCDGVELGGARCDTQGFVSGLLRCSPSCHFDESDCMAVPPSGCGNRVAEPGEDCDGSDFRGMTCASLGHGSGALACTVGCLLEPSGCISAPVCGDGKADGAEACDGADLGPRTCESEGFASGALSCSAECRLVTSACESGGGAVCGNGLAEGLEDCDGSDLGQRTCESEGLGSGSLGCSPACKLVTSGCTSLPQVVCGDMLAGGDEDCDGNDLGGGSCTAAGFSGGVLACGAGCRFDTALCTAGPACDVDAGGRTGVVLRADTSTQTSRVTGWSCSSGGSGPDVSATWTAPTTGCYQVMVTSDRDIDTLLGVFADCSLGHSLACDDNGGADQFSLLEFDATVGTTYAVVVDSYYKTDAGPIQVRLSPCAPAAWACDPTTFGRGDGCDCGCAVLDPDCDDDSSAGACDFCDPAGSCAAGKSCESIREDENWACN